MSNFKKKISIVIPYLYGKEFIEPLISSLLCQSNLPDEIVIIDSSHNFESQKEIKKLNLKFPPINCFHVRKSGKELVEVKDQVLQSSKSLFSFEAINFGIKKSQYALVGILDIATFPTKHWIKDYLEFMEKENDVIFGSTKFHADSFFQKLFKASTFGSNPLETCPGSIAAKSLFLNFPFAQGVRAGADILWRNQVRMDFAVYKPNKSYLVYKNISKSISKAIKKTFIYQLHSAKLDIQNSTRDIYFGLSLIVLTLCVHRWNYLVGWEGSILYIPNITKYYFITLYALIIGIFFLNKPLIEKVFRRNILKNSILTIFFITLLISAYRWNALIANWQVDSIFYIPHITKLFISSILITSIIYRGIVFPLRNNEKLEFLFPINWFFTGCIGLLLDITKAPGYLIGSVLKIFKKSYE